MFLITYLDVVGSTTRAPGFEFGTMVGVHGQPAATVLSPQCHSLSPTTTLRGGPCSSRRLSASLVSNLATLYIPVLQSDESEPQLPPTHSRRLRLSPRSGSRAPHPAKPKSSTPQCRLL